MKPLHLVSIFQPAILIITFEFDFLFVFQDLINKLNSHFEEK